MKKVKVVPYSLLAFFLGWIGIHKFYTGKNHAGIWYLIFSFTGIPAVIAVFTAFRSLLNSDQDDFVYLKENGAVVAKKDIPKNKSEIKLATDFEPDEIPFYKTIWFWPLLIFFAIIDFFVFSLIVITFIFIYTS